MVDETGAGSLGEGHITVGSLGGTRFQVPAPAEVKPGDVSARTTSVSAVYTPSETPQSEPLGPTAIPPR